MNKTVYTICTRTGGVALDQYREKIDVFYVSTDRDALLKHVDKKAGERVKPLSKSLSKRAWGLMRKLTNSFLEVEDEVLLAATTKRNAKALADVCRVQTTPALFC